MGTAVAPKLALDTQNFRQILGVTFFIGYAADAVSRMCEGGLLVVPAAPALKNLPRNAGYREALLNADLVISDSGFMVLIWNWIQGDHIKKLSGLAYLRELLGRPEIRNQSSTFWIMASPSSATRNLRWLSRSGIDLSAEDIYLAPIYGDIIADEALLERLRARHPKHIIITLGGGSQERLGLYLKRNLDFRPAIHCIGAAIAFLSGDQVHIPVWADRCYVGWLFRCVSGPRRYVARYWEARKLLPLLLRYRQQLPLQ